MEKMKIEIWSDIACPYCYIGKRKLEEALKTFPHSDQIELVWNSYELDPSLPKIPLNTNQQEQNRGSHKGGSKGIMALAEGVGLEYNYDKLIGTNTSDALRLVKLAKKYNLADQAEEVLFKAYFTDGKNISDKQTLIELGEGIGLTKQAIVDMLNSDEYLEDIVKDIRYSEDILDLQFIPFYLFNNKLVIQGSLAEEDYLDALTKSFEDWKQNGISKHVGERKDGRGCSPDGTCSL